MVSSDMTRLVLVNRWVLRAIVCITFATVAFFIFEVSILNATVSEEISEQLEISGEVALANIRIISSEVNEAIPNATLDEDGSKRLEFRKDSSGAKVSIALSGAMEATPNVTLEDGGSEPWETGKDPPHANVSFPPSGAIEGTPDATVHAESSERLKTSNNVLRANVSLAPSSREVEAISNVTSTVPPNVTVADKSERLGTRNVSLTSLDNAVNRNTTVDDKRSQRSETGNFSLSNIKVISSAAIAGTPNATMHPESSERLNASNDIPLANLTATSSEANVATPNQDSGDWFEVKCLPPSMQTRMNTSNNEEWCLDTSFIWRYNITAGSSRRRTKQGIERCMANKHLLLIGDSRTRYQYMSLAVLLARGEFVRCKEVDASLPNQYCEFAYLSPQGWATFFQSSNRVLRTNNSSELCYCARPKNRGRKYEHTRENRFFTQETKFGPIRIMYLQSYQDSCNLDISFPPYNRGRLSCDVPGTCSRRINETFNNREVNFASAIECFRNVSMTAEPPVTHAFVTTGWAQKDIGCDLVRIAKATGIKTWMIEAPSLNGFNDLIPATLPKQSCNVPIFERFNMTLVLKKNMFFDTCHVQSSVNEEFNHRLMDLLCPQPIADRRSIKDAKNGAVQASNGTIVSELQLNRPINATSRTSEGPIVEMRSIRLNNTSNNGSSDGLRSGQREQGTMHHAELPKREKNDSNQTIARQEVNATKIYPVENLTFIGLDKRFGRTCNSLKSIATVVYRANQQARGVALSAHYSQALDDTLLDIAAFTAFNPTVPLLLDCEFRKKNTEGSCRRRYQNGILTMGTTIEVRIARLVIGHEAFHDLLHTVEIMNVMMGYRLPQADERMVDGVLDQLRVASRSNLTVGVHRRALEGLCYKWLVSYVHIPSYSSHKSFGRGGRCHGVTENGIDMDESTERCYRDVSMLYSLCNFTLSGEEVKFVRQVSGWGDFLETREYGLLLATDKQVPKGDAAIGGSAPVTFQLADFLPRKYSEIGLLMREMYALSRTDYFVSQPLSSCDWIVQYWRVRRWNRTVNSTFPPNQIFKYFSAGANESFI